MYLPIIRPTLDELYLQLRLTPSSRVQSMKNEIIVYFSIHHSLEIVQHHRHDPHSERAIIQTSTSRHNMMPIYAPHHSPVPAAWKSKAKEMKKMSGGKKHIQSAISGFFCISILLRREERQEYKDSNRDLLILINMKMKRWIDIKKHSFFQLLPCFVVPGRHNIHIHTVG